MSENIFCLMSMFVLRLGMDADEAARAFEFATANQHRRIRGFGFEEAEGGEPWKLWVDFEPEDAKK